MANKGFDFSGLATKYNVRCADERTILHGAFDDMDGVKVPLIYNHDHKNPKNVLGYAILHSVDDGLRADSYLDEDSDAAQEIKRKMKMGTPFTYSIHATDLRQRGKEVLHGIVREVSVVLAGANPGAVIDSFALSHELGYSTDEEAYICFEEELSHSLDSTDDDSETSDTPEGTDENEGQDDIEHSADNKSEEDKKEDGEEPKKKTVEDVLNSMTDEQREVTYGLMAVAAEGNEKKEENEGGNEMAHTNLFESAGKDKTADLFTLTHADKEQILSYAEDAGSLQKGIARFVDEKTASLSEEDANELSHSLDANGLTYLLPEFKNANGDGQRDEWTDDMSWVDTVISGAYKVPFARIKTETIDMRGLRAKGWSKGNKKTEIGESSVLHRETTPTWIYAKEEVSRQDILDLHGNFDYIPFIRKQMQMAFKIELAYDTLFGDGRPAGNDKVREECIRPIWKDDELYAMHVDLDTAAMAAELQGSDTTKYFGEGFIETEAFVKTMLDAQIDYHGRGNMIGFMDPWYVNKMLLAKDRDGHRMYKDKDELAKALGLKKIETVQQIKDLENRSVVVDGVERQKKLICIAVNMQDYVYGNVKGGEVTHFEDFDIDYNQNKYLDETYLSGALRRIKSAIIVEKDVTTVEEQPAG